MAGKHYHHGNTPAAWAGVIIMIIGFCVGSVYTLMAEPLGVAAAGGIVVLGGIVGLVMRAMGLGQGPAAAGPRQGADAPAVEAQNAAGAETRAASEAGAGVKPQRQPEPASEPASESESEPGSEPEPVVQHDGQQPQAAVGN